MADADEVWAAASTATGVRYSALVPNTRGAQRALAAGFRELEVVVSACDTHNRRNVNRSTDESLDDIAALIDAAARAPGASVEVIVSTSFGCPFEGDVDPRPGRRPSWTGCSPTAPTGSRSATPPAWPRRAGSATCWTRSGRGQPDVPVLLHFHNTRGTALANILTALEYGVTEFDASVGGLGGCPYAPGATGNVATEEVVHMLHDMGIDTGIDLDRADRGGPAGPGDRRRASCPAACCGPARGTRSITGDQTVIGT